MKLPFPPFNREKKPKGWWVTEHSSVWREWARIESGGRINIYDDKGIFVRGTDYGSRREAIASMKRMGYRRLARKDTRSFSPPEIK